MNFSVVEKNLKDRGYVVTIFETTTEAVKYLDMQIDNQTIGFGGSVTLEQMKLFETLQRHNTVASISFAIVCSVNSDKDLILALIIGRIQFGTCS